MKQGPRVLVTDAEQRPVVAMCRGLAEAGYHVSTVSEKRLAVGHWSRFSKEQIVLAGPQTDPQGYVERLSQVLRRGEYELVIPGGEVSLLPISERRDLIDRYTRLGLPPHEVVLRALDKPLLHNQAAAVGLAPPRSVMCSSYEEALTAAKQFAFPLLVKPARSVIWVGGRRRHQKGQVVADATLFEATVAAVGVPLMLQEYVPKPTIVSYAGVRVDGRVLGLTVARYVRTYPQQSGDAAMATTIEPPRRLTQQVEELLGLIGWCGIFELELLELGENRFGAIDLNPRPFGWMALAVEAGANLPALWSDYVLGRRSASPDGARAGIRYRWEGGDICNGLAQLRRGRFRSAVVVLQPHRRVVHPHFRIDDPAPLGVYLLSESLRYARGGSRRRGGGPRLLDSRDAPRADRACPPLGLQGRGRGPQGAGRQPRNGGGAFKLAGSHRTAEEGGPRAVVAKGKSNAEIVRQLFLAEGTVKQHLRAAYKLLGVGRAGHKRRVSSGGATNKRS